MFGWNPFKYDPGAGGLEASSRVLQGMRTNRIEHGTPADHVVRVAYHGTVEADFSFVALLDPTRDEKDAVRSGLGKSSDLTLAAVGGRVGIDVVTADPNELPDGDDGRDAEVDSGDAYLEGAEKPKGLVGTEVPQASEDAENAPRRSRRNLISLQYAELPLPRQWDHEHEVGPGYPVNRQAGETVVHPPTFECRGGREHTVWIGASLTPKWPGANPTRAWLQFVVICRPA